MELFIATVIIIGLAIAGRAIGVLFSGRGIQGSCGGLSRIIPGLESACDACAAKDECPRSEGGARS
jgi:hypothetical protein